MLYFCVMDLTFSLETLEETAALFWAAAASSRVFAFHGEMGSGKTTFIQALCRTKGIQDHPSSPSFSIINEYQYKNGEGGLTSLYHLDLYRLADAEEALRAGVEDCLDQPAICFIEWPEILDGLLPTDTLHIYLSVLPNQKRRILTV